MNTQEFIAKAQQVHGDAYDYSEAIFTTYKGKARIRCKKHDLWFDQQAGNHMNGSGCPTCGRERKFQKSAERARTKEEFIEQARARHGDLYEYQNLPDRCRTTAKVEVVCAEHGVFEQQVDVHLNGAGCPRCHHETSAAARTLDADDVIARFAAHHPDLEFRSEYSGMHHPLTAYCPKHDYEFTRKALTFKDRGCPKCGVENQARNPEIGLAKMQKHNEAEQARAKQEFEAFVENTYKGPLTFDMGSYTKQRVKMRAFCPVHGEIEAIPGNIMEGHGCYACSLGESRPIRKYKDFYAQAHAQFPEFEYNKASYKGMNKRMWIKCPTHGWIQMVPKYHLQYLNGCSKCNPNTSQYETQIGVFVESLGFKVEYNVRNVLPVMYGGISEIDVYVPEKKVGIEFHGLWWHTVDPVIELSKNRKMTLNQEEQADCLRRLKYKCLDKLERAQEVGVRLVQVFHDEWRDSQEAVKNRLRAVLGVAQRLYARDLTVVRATTPHQIEAVRAFITRVHTQKDRPTQIMYMLVDEVGDIKMAATFGKAARHAEYELVRVASVGVVVGGLSRLLKAFIRDYAPASIMSYCDLRYGTGTGYEAVGFGRVGMTEPDWWWLQHNTARDRTPRQATMSSRTHLYPQLHEALQANPGQSIQSVAYELGWRKLFGTGSAIYVLDLSEGGRYK